MQDAKVFLASGERRIGVAVSDKIAPALKPGTVIVDFTNPEASLNYLEAAAKSGTPMVIATTGFK